MLINRISLDYFNPEYPVNPVKNVSLKDVNFKFLEEISFEPIL
jgi:hypothetical protein